MATVNLPWDTAEPRESALELINARHERASTVLTSTPKWPAGSAQFSVAIDTVSPVRPRGRSTTLPEPSSNWFGDVGGRRAGLEAPAPERRLHLEVVVDQPFVMVICSTKTSWVSQARGESLRAGRG